MVKTQTNQATKSQVVEAKLSLVKAEAVKLEIPGEMRMEPGGHLAPLQGSFPQHPPLIGVALPNKEDNRPLCEKAVKMQPKGKEEAEAKIGQ